MAEEQSESHINVHSENRPATIPKSSPDDRELRGPFDIKELAGIKPYIDLGSIRIEPREGLQIRLDVDQQQKRVVAVSLDYDGSTLQLQAFAAPKKAGLWLSIRDQVLNHLNNQKAKLLERDGIFGPEIITQMSVNSESGPVLTTVRFVGVDGPRWLLRGAITGKAMTDQQVSEKMEEIFRSTVVVRGDQPMPPGELLPLKVPASVNKK